jgi:serine/threonine protein kinase
MTLGMGEAYCAKDTNLSREVAIKVLPEQFTQGPQRLARFEREAKLLAPYSITRTSQSSMVWKRQWLRLTPAGYEAMSTDSRTP